MTTPVQTANDSADAAIMPFMGWVALLGGVFLVVRSILFRFGVLSATLYLERDALECVVGFAMLVGGFLVCRVIPPLHRRVSALERRIESLEKNQSVGVPNASDKE